MALQAKNPQHALQILAGINGRKRGHEFEFDLAHLVNTTPNNINSSNEVTGVFHGFPEVALIKKALNICNWLDYDAIEAIPIGALATAEEGKKWLKINGITVKSSKSDILLNIHRRSELQTVGVSVKQSSNNPQLFLSTATAFCNLLRRNNIAVSDKAEIAMKQFCGDVGFRPIDYPNVMMTRKSHPLRFYWEEILPEGLIEWEMIFTRYQNHITTLLLQKAYSDDSFPPEIIMQKTKKVSSSLDEFATYSINELVSKSANYAGFFKTLKTEVSKSKSYDVPIGVQHECPKFGIIQMQRLGNKQNATQLQFNLKAGYFYNI